MNKWDKRFMKLAEHVATWSKDPSTKVGAVIVDEQHRIVSLGFNGFPRGIEDNERLTDRPLKYEMILHAEVNAIHFANKSVEGCTLYVYPLPPCSRCASQIIQSGISRVVSKKVEKGSKWEESNKLAIAMLKEAGVSYFCCV